MKRPGGRVAVLGGGMAGLAAAWRLSEPGWQQRFDGITVYQRGGRLGGKAASSRGEHGRIQEHGLHVWLGSYENAFALLRACYAELDRDTTDPDAPIRSWQQALIPAANPGLAEEVHGTWQTWLGTHPGDTRLPGDPDNDGRDVSVPAFLERALTLLAAFARSVDAGGEVGLSLSPWPDPAHRPRSSSASVLLRAVTAALATLNDPRQSPTPAVTALDEALGTVGDSVDHTRGVSDRRVWVLVSLVAAAIRGVLADNLVTDPAGLRAINDEEFGDWLLRHGGHPDVLDSALVRGLYDLVFGYRSTVSGPPGVAAGTMVFLVGQALFTYKGAFFWKMTAGMGDVVIAPLYQALKARGVRFEFFHRLDGLHLDPSRRAIDSITMGRQATLAHGVEEYDPLIRVGGLPVFPAAPRADQLGPGQVLDDTESHFGVRADVETRTLRKGVDFDHVVLAVSLGMVPIVGRELIADRAEWRQQVSEVSTVATQAFQLWLRPDEPALGWTHPGSTVSGYLRPFETWASMPQTLWSETWPAADTPGTVAYFCGSLDAAWPTEEPAQQYVERLRRQVLDDATAHLDNLRLFFPAAFTDAGFDWSLLMGAAGLTGAAAVATQHLSVNIDPSDRYVQSLPGSDRFRLRPDESGYDNLVLAGDWTDCGMNAGCIEAAVMSGLQAANAISGRGRFHRIRGYWLP
jgi:uncharacterized protein with NAD-binding domain and iron-sulfur cluster